MITESEECKWNNKSSFYYCKEDQQVIPSVSIYWSLKGSKEKIFESKVAKPEIQKLDYMNKGKDHSHQ